MLKKESNPHCPAPALILSSYLRVGVIPSVLTTKNLYSLSVPSNLCVPVICEHYFIWQLLSLLHKVQCVRKRTLLAAIPVSRESGSGFNMLQLILGFYSSCVITLAVFSIISQTGITCTKHFLHCTSRLSMSRGWQEVTSHCCKTK